jgi:hypothetical protein
MPEVMLEGRALKILPIRNKKPCLKGGYAVASADPDQIREMFSRCPGADVGVACGEANDFDVLDVDPRDNGDKWLAENLHRIPQTRSHKTAGGGAHFLFRYASGLRNSSIAPGVDIKTTGGLIRWHPANGHEVHDVPIVPWPSWLLELARKPEPRPIRGAGDGPHFFNATSASDGWMIPNVLWFKLKAATPGASDHDRYRMRGLLRTIVQKPEGGQNNALNWSAYHFREWIDAGAISREAAEELLLEAARWSGYVERDGLADTVATICSGLGA